MQLIEIFLPVYQDDNTRFASELYAQTRAELVEKFGGLTTHSRAPLKGLWQAPAGDTVRDDLIIYEIITEHLDEAWWQQYRRALQQRFAQTSLMIRAQEITLIGDLN
jgi:hypothetical protein